MTRTHHQTESKWRVIPPSTLVVSINYHYLDAGANRPGKYRESRCITITHTCAHPKARTCDNLASRVDFSRPSAYDLPDLLPGARVVDLVRVPSLYVITHGPSVEYVGRTNNWIQRLERHQRTRTDGRPLVGPPELAPERMLSAIVVPCRHSLTLRERALIAWLRPACNAPVVLDRRLRGVLENWLKL